MIIGHFFMSNYIEELKIRKPQNFKYSNQIS
jgi:hypothetical protein